MLGVNERAVPIKVYFRDVLRRFGARRIRLPGDKR